MFLKYNKNADTLLFLLLFTNGQCEKILKKIYWWVQALKKGEKQRGLREYFTAISTES